MISHAEHEKKKKNHFIVTLHISNICMMYVTFGHFFCHAHENIFGLFLLMPNVPLECQNGSLVRT